MGKVRPCTLPFVVLVVGALYPHEGHAGEAPLHTGEVMVSCKPGSAPGQFFYFPNPVLPSPTTDGKCPRCFSVDQAGVFHLPEILPYRGIRVHKFKKDGQFKVMWGLLSSPGVKGGYDYDEASRVHSPRYGTPQAVHAIAVVEDGPTYLALERTGDPGILVNTYSHEGRFQFHLGPRGVIDPDLLTEERAHEAVLFKNVTRLAVTTAGDLVVQDGPDGAATVYRFDGKGVVLGHSDALPAELAENAAAHAALYTRLAAAFEANEQDPPPKSHTVLAPDGHLYYMAFDEKTLEIHRVTFPR